MSRKKEYIKTDLSFDDLLRAGMGVPLKGEQKGKALPTGSGPPPEPETEDPEQEDD